MITPNTHGGNDSSNLVKSIDVLSDLGSLMTEDQLAYLRRRLVTNMVFVMRILV